MVIPQWKTFDNPTHGTTFGTLPNAIMWLEWWYRVLLSKICMEWGERLKSHFGLQFTYRTIIEKCIHAQNSVRRRTLPKSHFWKFLGQDGWTFPFRLSVVVSSSHGKTDCKLAGARTTRTVAFVLSSVVSRVLLPIGSFFLLYRNRPFARPFCAWVEK
jgi:hypothetical protein